MTRVFTFHTFDRMMKILRPNYDTAVQVSVVIVIAVAVVVVFSTCATLCFSPFLSTRTYNAFFSFSHYY
jgi:hypothetical protein